MKMNVSRAALFSGGIGLLFLALPAPGASQTTGQAGSGSGSPGVPAQHPCFTQLVEDLKVCKDNFCGLTGCQPAYYDCRDGAKAVFKSCMDSYQ